MEFSPAPSQPLSYERKQELKNLKDTLLEESVRRFILSKARRITNPKEDTNFGLTFEEKDVAFIYADIIKELLGFPLSSQEKQEIDLKHDMIRTELFRHGFHLKKNPTKDTLSQVLRPTTTINVAPPTNTKKKSTSVYGIRPPTAPPPDNTRGKGAAANDKPDTD